MRRSPHELDTADGSPGATYSSPQWLAANPDCMASSQAHESDCLPRRAVPILLLFARGGATPHVQSPDGEAKFWIEPQIELARNYELSEQDLSRALQLVVDREQEIRDAWHKHVDT
jgi:hypothetical protein